MHFRALLQPLTAGIDQILIRENNPHSRFHPRDKSRKKFRQQAIVVSDRNREFALRSLSESVEIRRHPQITLVSLESYSVVAPNYSSPTAWRFRHRAIVENEHL